MPDTSAAIAVQPHWVVVQAGGRGSRLRHHTWNKPKCLVSVDGRPLLYHLFARFPGSRFIVIGDYAFEQLQAYLRIVPPSVEVRLIRAREKGTAAGIGEALRSIPGGDSVLILWSDLVVGRLPPWPPGELPVVCITDAFPCRWTVSAVGAFVDRPGTARGVPGLFFLPQARTLGDVPESGEFVRWLSSRLSAYRTLDCPDLQELGDFAALESHNDRSGFSRFFNRVTVGEDVVEKDAIDPSYSDLIGREAAWYREAAALGFRRAPRLIGERPLRLERVRGQHPHEMVDLTPRERRAVLADCIDALANLHDRRREPANPDDVAAVYLRKTRARVGSVAAVVPFFDQESLTINGRKCRNVFSLRHQGELDALLEAVAPEHFAPIHGDPTFSNCLVDAALRAWFIDPRGYFARPGIMGDANYDFAKLYYSAIGGYDAFNRRRFKLYVDGETVEVFGEEPPFARVAREVFSGDLGDRLAVVQILHGLVWLGLAGYVRDDVDSIIASFCLGLYWLEDGRDRL